MSPEKASHETPPQPAQPEEQHDKERNSWLRQRSVWVGIGVILLLLVVGIILTNNRRTGVSPEQIALTPITSNADWTPVERDFDGITMVLVPAGCFMMGREDLTVDEMPVYQQCFNKPFWIDKYEVTWGQFRQFGGTLANPPEFTYDQYPVENITWFESRDFCKLRGMRLPTEAEWEYAARGPDSLTYPWGNEFNSDNVVFAWGYHFPVEVGSKPGGASWVGALDMSGNMEEWVNSLIKPYPYNAEDGRERDDNIDMNLERVLRGGAYFYENPDALTASWRPSSLPSLSSIYYGFRCSRDVGE